MGHKKRNAASRLKLIPAGSQPAAVGAAAEDDSYSSAEVELIPNVNRHGKSESSAPVELDGSSVYSTIKLECERALTALRRGNHTKALRLMKESVQRHENSAHLALIHRVQGTVCVKVASIIDDPIAKQRHLRNAIESARKAVELSPTSIEFSHFYANLLYEAANEPKEYEEVIQECERALSIDNPVDPAKESLQEESQQKISSAEVRITHMQNELRQLVQKSNIASLSTWMKTFGNGEDKFRLIPIRRVMEDPMEVRSVQTRRPNEIKKATKTLEERRKEIEVRVAAARLLQQKSEVPLLQNDGERSDRGLDLGSKHRGGDRRKLGNARKNRSLAERKDLVQFYWNSVTVDMKKELFRIRVSDLKAHFGLSKDGLAHEILLEALSFAETNRTWKFWICCRCGDKFVGSESHMHHVVQDHMGNLLPKMQSVLPQSVESKWIKMLLDCSWKPLDVSAVVKRFSNKTKFKESDHVEEFCSGNHTSGCDDCFKDAWDDSPNKGNLLDIRNSNEVEIIDNEKVVGNECTECDKDYGPMAYSSLTGNWPLADDPERAKLLERIHAVFEVLIRHKYLARSHLNRVIQFTVDELQGTASGSQLLNNGVEQIPLCICFLGASQLRKILKFLQELSKDCGLVRYAEKNDAPMDDAYNYNEGLNIKEQIFLNEDALLLLLHDSFLSDECTAISSNYDATDAAATFAIINKFNGILPDSDALLSWIFAGPTSGEQVALWMRTNEEKRQEGMEIFQMLEKEFYHLQSLCDRKCEHLSYEEALQAVEDLCAEEGKKRENATEIVHRSFEHALRKRREELLESENDVMLFSSRIELDTISNVLKEAEALNISQFGYAELYGGMTSKLCNLESGKDDDWRTKDYLHQVDTCIEVAIQRQKEHLYIELSKMDARIMRNVTGMQQLELKLEPVSAYDYRSVLLPFVKSYLRARLEDLAEKDATEKSDAAREAFLAELALDSKKFSKGGNNISRSAADKTKDKKKNKDNRKTKDSKVASIPEQLTFLIETYEQDSLSVASDCDHPDSEIIVSLNGDDLKQQEEEFRRRIELEAEERKLEETLEYQRRIEHEAKQKHLAEQDKKSAQVCPERVTEGLQNVSLEHETFASGAQEQLMPCMQEQLLHNNGFPNNQGGMPTITQNSHALSIRSTDPCAHVTSSVALLKVQGLTNEGTIEDGYLPCDRHAGKRNRCQKSCKISDGKHEAVTAGRENIGVENSLVENCLKGDHETKAFGQLHAEDDDDERFLADLNNAMQQSLDTFEAHKKIPPVSSLKTAQRTLGEADNIGDTFDNVQGVNASGGDLYGTGLKNEVGEYNCFLNVIIQSLWHIRRFRDELLQRSTSEHVHVGNPCVVCALYEIFTALSTVSADTRREAVAPTSLRVALSNLYPDSNFFQEAQMNDASEVLAVIFDCLHQSFTSESSVSDSESVESSCLGSWDRVNNACIVHSIFGMDIFECMNCYNCGLESRHLKYTSFFHNINASALRNMKVMHAESSFIELLNFVEMNHQLTCDPDAGGCGKFNYIHHILSTPPHVFTAVLGWQNTCESAGDITATLASLDTEININSLYRAIDSKKRHSLVSVVCYYGQHYHCFAYSQHHGLWIMYDDRTVKVIGSWANVIAMCERGQLQPQVLFFEAVN